MAILIDIFENNRYKDNFFQCDLAYAEVKDWCAANRITNEIVSELECFQLMYVSFGSNSSAVMFKLGFQDASSLTKQEFYDDLLEFLPNEIAGHRATIENWQQQEARMKGLMAGVRKMEAIRDLLSNR